MTNQLKKAKQEALNRLAIKCIRMNANAVIGVDIDIAVLSGNLLVVSTSGTAVVIENVK